MAGIHVPRAQAIVLLPFGLMFIELVYLNQLPSARSFSFFTLGKVAEHKITYCFCLGLSALKGSLAHTSLLF